MSQNRNNINLICGLACLIKKHSILIFTNQFTAQKDNKKSIHRTNKILHVASQVCSQNVAFSSEPSRQSRMPSHNPLSEYLFTNKWRMKHQCTTITYMLPRKSAHKTWRSHRSHPGSPGYRHTAPLLKYYSPKMHTNHLHVASQVCSQNVAFSSEPSRQSRMPSHNPLSEYYSQTSGE